MEEMTVIKISDVAKAVDVTPRMLRYYEKMDLIRSRKVPDYAYRVYDEENFQRIKQILFLRKLRLPLKDIQLILDDNTAQEAILIFEKNIAEINREIEAFDVIRESFKTLIQLFQQVLPPGSVLNNEKLLNSLFPNIPLPKTTLKEGITMEKLNAAEKETKKIEPRIVYLPPCTVAAAQYVEENPENHASNMIQTFMLDTDLLTLKPDTRLFGFNSPNPSEGKAEYGYEYWVTIPEDLAVPAPLVKKQFPGGQYAAHGIAMGNFQEWALLDEWVRTTPDFQYTGSGDPANMFGSLEEHLDLPTHFSDGPLHFDHLDLLIPVKKTDKEANIKK